MERMTVAVLAAAGWGWLATSEEASVAAPFRRWRDTQIETVAQHAYNTGSAQTAAFADMAAERAQCEICSGFDAGLLALIGWRFAPVRFLVQAAAIVGGSRMVLKLSRS